MANEIRISSEVQRILNVTSKAVQVYFVAFSTFSTKNPNVGFTLKIASQARIKPYYNVKLYRYYTSQTIHVL